MGVLLLPSSCLAPLLRSGMATATTALRNSNRLKSLLCPTTTSSWCARPQQSLWTGPTLLQVRKEALTESKAAQDGQVQTSFKEKAKENAKTAWYGGVIVVGVGVTAYIGYVMFSELFSGESPNGLFQRASEQCLANDKVVDLLGEPIKAFGEETRRGRRRHVSHLEYRDEQGRRGMRIKFYLQGLRKRGTAQLDVREDSTGRLATRFLIVTADDLLGTTVIVEDNRKAMN